MTKLVTGQRVKVRTERGSKFPAKVVDFRNISSRVAEVEVLIDGDPFPVTVGLTDIETEETHTMATKTARTARELRDAAKDLGIKGYSGMSKAELLEAVETAEAADGSATSEASEEEAPKKTKKRKSSSKKSSKSKASSKKSSSKKKAAKKASESEGPNPFREGTNLYHITEALMKGGKRQTLINKLKGKLEFNPRTKSDEEFDTEEEIDRRLKAVSYILEKDHGFTREHEGRGREATIKCTPQD